MRNSGLKKITLITIFLFIFLIFADGIPVYSENEKKGQTLKEEGQRLYDSGDYQGATDVWLQAVPLITERKNLADLYLLLSLANFKLGHKSRSEDFLRQMFELQPEKILKEDEFEADFLVIYNKVKAEYWFSFRTESKEDKDSQQKIIEKLRKKPKKKKKKILAFLIIGFLFVSAVVVTVILRNKKDNIYGKLLIFNNTDFIIISRLGVLERYIYVGEYTTYLLKEGSYDVEILSLDYSNSRIYHVDIKVNQIITLNFDGFLD